MKNPGILLVAVLMLSLTQYLHADSIADNYSTGDTLTATLLDNIKSAVNDNDSRVVLLEGFSYLVDGSSTTIGSIVGMNTDSWTIINTSGFVMQVRADGMPGAETVYFSGLNCTGTPYIRLGNSGASTPASQNAVWITQGYVVTDSIDAGIYYVPQGSSVQSGVTHESRYLTSGCQNTNDTMDAVQMADNVPGTTGVPATGYGAVSLP